MVTVIRKGSSKQIIQQLLRKISPKKGLDAYKYCGKIHLKLDSLLIQKQLRNEWE